MSITHTELLQFAKATLSGSTEETHWRTATSRAYYSLWHYSRELDESLIDNSGMVQAAKSGVHEKRICKLVHFPLRNSDNLSRDEALRIRAIGHSMRQCKQFRELADYEINSDLNKQFAETAIATIEKCISKMTTVLAPPCTADTAPSAQPAN